MNLFQLVLKQMRQRALGTSLTLLSVLLGVALAVAVLLARRESGRLFGQTDFGYEVLVGPPKGSPLQLTLNTVYHMDRSAGNVPYDVYEDLARKKQAPSKPFYAPWVRLAVPFMVGDSFNGHRIVGTSPQMFGFHDDGKPFDGYDDRGRRLPGFQDPDLPERQRDPDQPVAASTMEYRRGKKYVLAEGRVFHPRRFEAVIGSEVAARQGLKVGDAFKATHGTPAPGEEPDVHDLEWKVVGVLEPTRTANDGVLFIPVISLYAIEEHSSGLIQQALIKAGINPDAVPPEMVPEVLKKLGFDPDVVPPRSVMKLFRRAGATPPQTGPASRPADGELLKPAGGDQPIGELLRSTAPPPAAPEAHPADEKQHAEGEKHTDGTAHQEGDEHADHHGEGDKHSDGTVHKEGDEHADHDHGDHNHAHAEAFHFDDEGNIVPDLPEDEWEVSAVLVKTRGPFQTGRLLYDLQVGRTDATAVNPAGVMREFFNTFLRGSTLLLVVLAALVSVVAAVSILVSIYNSVSARQKEIAILRALGATRVRILTLICAEAGLIGLLGGLLGLVVGHAIAGVGSTYFERTVGEGIDWLTPSAREIIYLGVVVLIALLAGLVPALKAYRTPVATNLVAG